MHSPNGTAPVHLHDLLHKLVTGMGSRPRPNAERGEELTPVPVLIALTLQDVRGNAVHLTLDASEWALHPFYGGTPANLTLCAVVPPRYVLTDTEAPDPPAPIDHESVIPQAPDSGTMSEGEAAAVAATRAAMGLPAETDPDVLKANTDRPAGYGQHCWGGTPNDGDGP